MTRPFFYTTLLLLTIMLYACQQKNNKDAANTAPEKKDTAENKYIAIKNAAGLLQDGDLVTRSDNDLESLALQNFSDSDRTYSHSGIAFKEDNGFVVYHAMMGRENPSGLIRKDPFDSFVSPERKTGFGIFRYELSQDEKKRLHGILKENLAGKIPFDIEFDLQTDDSLYCSEMISKGLNTATKGRIVLPQTTILNFKPKLISHKFKQDSFKRFQYIAIDNLYLNPFCKEIIRVIY